MSTSSSAPVLTGKQIDQLRALVAHRGDSDLTRNELHELGESLFGGKYSLVWLRKRGDTQVARGRYAFKHLLDGSASAVPNVLAESVSKASAPAKASEGDSEASESAPASNAEAASDWNNNNSGVNVVSGVSSNVSYVPEKNKNYIRHSNFKIVDKIIKSGRYFPVFVTGLSGNGKTTMIEQACAATGREFFRVNITIETDEDDLLGGFRLVNGDTVWQDGPIVEAMVRGAVLLLDEIDLASNKIMCLQSVLEGKGIYLKKLNRFVKPAKGFTVFATANTKGKGNDEGQFAGTNVLNEAFLDRFPVTLYQDYPTKAQENKILRKILEDAGTFDDDTKLFSTKLVEWAQGIRKVYEEGGTDEIITTRRLVNIVEANIIFDDKLKAIKFCIERFDDDTKAEFLDYYTKLDASVLESEEDGNSESGASQEDVLEW